MKKGIKKIFIFSFVFVFFLIFLKLKIEATAITDFSVILSRIKTGVLSNQEIKFVTPSGVSSGETLEIQWSSEFNLNGIDYLDVDFAEGDTSSCVSSFFTERDLVSTSPSISEFGVSILGNTMTITSGGLNAQISPGVCVRIKIGIISSFGGVGDTQIINPSNEDDDDFIRIFGSFGDNGIQYIDIISSDQVSITATVAPSGGGGGGGGGGFSGGGFSSGVSFSGRAYPLSNVTLLRNGTIAITTVSGPDAKFNITLSNILSGNHTFTIYSTDSSGRMSNPFTLTLYITPEASTSITGIFLTPTIAVDKSIVRKGENLTVFGSTTPSSQVTIEVNSHNQLFFGTQSDSSGVYLLTFDTSPLELGDHGAKSKSKLDEQISEYSKIVSFKVGNQSDLIKDNACGLVVDLNSDCRVNLVDFSILAYWYKRPLPPFYIDFNKDGIVSIADFSVMAYYWTG